MLFSSMISAGLTGGLATGKSTVARLFRRYGAIVLDADVLARKVVEPGRPAWRDIVEAYGSGVLRKDRRVDRAALARIVFWSRAKLRRLNSIVHPRVAREQARLSREVARINPHAIIIYDAPLLIEAGAHHRMDRIIVVHTDRETQVLRLQRRDHLTRAEAMRRIRAQMPLWQKIKYADYVIDGKHSPRRLRLHVKRIYLELKHLA